MANKKFIVELSSEERKHLETMVSKGKAAAKIILKARILLKADQSVEGAGWTDEKICQALDTNIAMVTRVRSKLVTAGFDAVFVRKKRATPPVQPIFDGERQAQLIALAARNRRRVTPAGRCGCLPIRPWNARSWPRRTSIQSAAR